MTYAKGFTVCTLVGCALALAACCSTAKNQDKKEVAAMKILTESDTDSMVALAVGSSFDIQLKANASTGYGWKLLEKNDAVVEQKGEMEYATDPHPEGMVGVGGVSTFHFVAKNAGKATLKFAYSRPWETKPPVKTYAVTIEAK